MPLLKRLHKVAPNYTPKIAALDGCQAQNRQAAAPPPVPFPLPPHSCTVLRGSRNQSHPEKSTSCTTSILKESSMELLCYMVG